MRYLKYVLIYQSTQNFDLEAYNMKSVGGVLAFAYVASVLFFFFLFVVFSDLPVLLFHMAVQRRLGFVTLGADGAGESEIRINNDYVPHGYRN